MKTAKNNPIKYINIIRHNDNSHRIEFSRLYTGLKCYWDVPLKRVKNLAFYLSTQRNIDVSSSFYESVCVTYWNDDIDLKELQNED